MDARTMAGLSLVLLIVTAPLELSQLAFAMVGALAYVVANALTPVPKQSSPKVLLAQKDTPVSVPRTPLSGCASKLAGANKPAGIARKYATIGAGQSQPAPACPPNSRPISKLCFKSTEWDDEVQELLDQITPSAQADKAVRQLAGIVQRELNNFVPGIEVVGFTSGDLNRGSAFGVAVPEVDIVASINPQVHMTRAQGARSNATQTRNMDGATQADARKLQKSSIRACTDRLVGSGHFKFRRSAFRGQDPKVTLLASAALGIHDEAIPIDFSVNSTTPLYNAALLTECGKLDPRSRALILLAKRWAKGRGICYTAQGHLPPYAWTLLVIYFLQVGGDSGPLLPPLEGFELSAGLAIGQASRAGDTNNGGSAQRAKWVSPDGQKKSIGALFKEFVHFYADEFDFRNEAVSIRSGRRAPPGLGLPLHIIEHEDNSNTEVAPSIEDPFDPKHNLGECSTAFSFARLREEFARAQALCQRGASLVELLEPWMPQEHMEGAAGQEE